MYKRKFSAASVIFPQSIKNKKQLLLLKTGQINQSIKYLLPSEIVLASESIQPRNHLQQLPSATVTVRLVEDPLQPRNSQQQLPGATVRLVYKNSDKKEETTASKKSHLPDCETQWNKLLQLWRNNDCLVQELIAHTKGDPCKDNLKAGNNRLTQ